MSEAERLFSAIRADCICLNAPLPYDQYEAIRFIGVDETDGRVRPPRLGHPGVRLRRSPQRVEREQQRGDAGDDPQRDQAVHPRTVGRDGTVH